MTEQSISLERLEETINVFGSFDENIRIIEGEMEVSVVSRDVYKRQISDNRYMGMDSISLIDLWEGWQVTRSPMRLMPLGGTGLPQSSLRGSCARAGRGYGLLFQHEGEGRTLHAHMDLSLIHISPE